jgi:hypothetical protein
MPKSVVFGAKLGLQQGRNESGTADAPMCDRKGDFEPSDGGEDDDSHTIGRFLGSGVDVVGGGPDGDGEYTEPSEFVSLRESSRITRGIAVSGMTRVHALALGQGRGARECTIPKRLLMGMFNVDDRQGLDRAMQNVG